MAVDVRIVSPEQLRRLAAELRDADRNEFGRALRDVLKEEAEYAADSAKDAVRALHITGDGAKRGRPTPAHRAHALRENVAAATGVHARPRGVEIAVNSSDMPEGQRSLPGHLESRKGWRHPVFGNRNVWAAERGGPWFYPSIRRHESRIRDRLDRAMNDAAIRLAQKVG